LICTEAREGLQDNYYFSTKHEIVSELYFKFNKTDNYDFNRLMAQILFKIYDNNTFLFKKIIKSLSENYNGLAYFNIYEIINSLRKEKITYSNDIEVIFDISILNFYDNKQEVEKLLNYSQMVSEKYKDNDDIRNALAKYKIQYSNYKAINSTNNKQSSIYDSFSDIENTINENSDSITKIEFYYNNKLYEKVIDNIDLLLEKEDFDLHKQSIEKLIIFINAYIKTKRFNEAESLLNKFLKIDNSNIQVILELSKIYKYQNRHEDTINLLAKSKKLEVNSKIELAKTYQYKSRYDDAINLLKDLLSKNPFSIDIKIELSKVYQIQKKYDDAEIVLLNIIELDSVDSMSRFEVSQIHQKMNKFKNTVDILDNNLKTNPNDQQARAELAKVYQIQKRHNDAEKVLLDLLVIDKDNLQARTELAKVYQTLKKYDDAEKVLLDLLVIDEDNLQARTELAKVYQTLKKYDDAEKVLLESLEIDNKQLHPRTELAKVYQTLKKYDDAEKVLLESLEISRFGFHAMAGLIRLYSDISKPRKAFKKVDEFLSQKGLKFFGGSSSRAHQALFNNLFFLCKRYRYFDEAKKYYKDYENILDSRNINSYNFNIKEKNFTYKEKDLIGFVQEIDDHKIVIDNKKYKNYRFKVEVGAKVIFDLDFSHNIRNIEKLD